MVAPLVWGAARWAFMRAAPALGRLVLGNPIKTTLLATAGDTLITGGDNTIKPAGDALLRAVGLGNITTDGISSVFNTMSEGFGKLGLGDVGGTVITAALGGILAKMLLPGAMGSIGMMLAIATAALTIYSSMSEKTPVAAAEPALVPAS